MKAILNHHHDYLSNADTKRDYNKQLFSIVAPRYRSVTAILSFGKDKKWKSMLTSELLPDTGGKLLDIATGNADLALLFRKQAPAMKITGCDLSSPMLHLSINECRKSSISLALHDMARLGFADNSFEAVSGGYALRNAPDLQKTISEIHRVLRPGGSGFFLEFSRSGNPVVSFCQLTALWFWSSFWGVFFHGNPAVYGYLAETLRAYPPRRELHALFRNRGFEIVKSRTMMAGLIELLVIKKL